MLVAKSLPSPLVDWYVACAVPTVRTALIAAASLAAWRDFSKLGIAIAAMMPMMATTINSSISEKPFSFFIKKLAPFRLFLLLPHISVLATFHREGNACAI